jgi:hypothetical protein
MGDLALASVKSGWQLKLTAKHDLFAGDYEWIVVEGLRNWLDRGVECLPINNQRLLCSHGNLVRGAATATLRRVILIL